MSTAHDLRLLAVEAEAALRRINRARHAFFRVAIGVCDQIADAGDAPPYWVCGAAEASLKAAADALWDTCRHLHELNNLLAIASKGSKA